MSRFFSLFVAPCPLLRQKSGSEPQHTSPKVNMKPFSLPDQRLVMFDRHVVSVLFDLSSSRDEQRMWRYKQSDAMKAGITVRMISDVLKDDL